MKVYHGSDIKIETIDLSKCRIGTDFGRGFYVTKFFKQAEDIAARVALWHKLQTCAGGETCPTSSPKNVIGKRRTAQRDNKRSDL